ncbi:MAG: DUF4118 domain-containing protein, partial [Bacteroidetes bacterium]|nr:DUF4118 domain-containing protein [Bacteroidota bacterium]
MDTYILNKNKPRSLQYLIGTITVLAVALAGFSFSAMIDYRVVAFFLLVTVSILAMFFDILPVLLAAFLSALIWDFFFIPPHYTLTVGSTEDELTLVMYFVIALINAVLTYKIRQIEKQAREKEEKESSLKLYNTLFNSLSHELQTPISTIMGAADTLKENYKLTDTNKNVLVNEISIASFRLKEQVENLLNMSRLESGNLRLKKDWCDVNELIHSTVNKLQNKLGDHKIEITVADNFPLFKLDYGIMEQVLHNLINNALQHTPVNSSISIIARYTTTGNFDVNENLKNGTPNTLLITIADDGKGFPENEIEKVFGKFYRLHHSHVGGTGLGLSIVKGFLEAHEGTVILKNIPTGGAEFMIEIPAHVSHINT